MQSDGGRGDWFGGAVAVSNETIAVGASWADSNVASSGAAYIYKRVNGNSRQLQAKINPQSPVNSGLFGASIDIEADRVIIGSISEDAYRGKGSLFFKPLCAN